ncbi:MAG: protein kinase [Planctomycetota bacterium]
MPDHAAEWSRVLDLARRLSLVAGEPGSPPDGEPSPERVGAWIGVPPKVAGGLLRVSEAGLGAPPGKDTVASLALGEGQLLALAEAIAESRTRSSRGTTPEAPTVLAGTSAGVSAATRFAPPPEPGETPSRLGHYEILGELGHGGMGVVYRAGDTRLGREVALKVLLHSGFASKELVERFYREARAAATLEHPGIVQIHDVGEAGGRPYYTMQLLAGRGLDEAIRDHDVSLKEVVDVVRQLAEALRYAHGRGILHRDIKPRNVVVHREDGRVVAKLVDFGLAKFVEEELTPSSVDAEKSVLTLTKTGQLLGTPAYMSPEQVAGAKDVDGRADLYSLGASLYEGLTGVPPFLCASLSDLLEAIQNEDPVPPRRRNRDVDEDLETICLKCLHKDPKDRYPSAADLAEDCRRWLAGEPIQARPLGTIARVWRRARRNQAVAVPVAAASVVALGAVLWLAGTELARRVNYARGVAEAEQALSARCWGDAASAARWAADAAPSDRHAQDLLDRALAGEATDLGRAALLRYRRHREEAVHLAEKAKEAERLEKAASLEERPARKAQRWRVEEALRVEETSRESVWSEAVLRFTEALTHWKEQEDARDGLAELYWDRFRAADESRDATAMNTYHLLVEEFGGESYRAMLRGEREVRVRFLLPPGAAEGDVEAWLYRYERKAVPPVLVPVPFDVQRGTSIAGARLAEEPEFGRPVPLAKAGEEEIVAAARERSVYPLEAGERNRVVLVPARGAPPGRPALSIQVRLPRGAYLLHIPAGGGRCEVRYPFEVARDVEWNEVTAIESDALPPLLPSAAALKARPAWCFVCAGPFRASGDPKAGQSPERDAAILRAPKDGTDGYFLSRFEVTSAMYLEYLNDRSWHDAGAAQRRTPRSESTATTTSLYWKPDAEGNLTLGWGAEYPATSICWEDADDYCKWATKRAGQGTWVFELPTEDEWERAARGVDGRYFPWGDSFDTTFCKMGDARVGEMDYGQPEKVGLFPIDESPFGLRDLGGGVEEWVADKGGPEGDWRTGKGGGWGLSPSGCRAAGRGYVFRSIVCFNNGLRVLARRAR